MDLSYKAHVGSVTGVTFLQCFNVGRSIYAFLAMLNLKGGLHRPMQIKPGRYPPDKTKSNSLRPGSCYVQLPVVTQGPCNCVP